MRTARFASQFSVPIGTDGTAKIWPAGWAGPVDDDVVAALKKEGRAAELDPIEADEEAKPAGQPSGPVEIPAGWESFKAADLVDLAHRLGAPDDVKTKDPAVEFIAKVVAERASAGQ